MSFFGNLLKIIAIGAFFIATGPFGLIIGSSLGTVLRIGGVVLSYLGALIDRPRLLQDRQQLTISTTLEPNTPIPVVYGRGKVGAIVADWFLNPVPANLKQLYYIAVFAHGSRDGLGIAGFDELWFDQGRAVRLIEIISSSVANPTVITTRTAHGLTTGDTIWIAGHAGSSPNLNGHFGPGGSSVTVTGTTTFTVPTNVTTGGTGGLVVFYTRPYEAVTANFSLFYGTTTQNVGGTGFSILGTGVLAPGSVTNSGWNLTTDTGKAIACVGFVLVNVDVTNLAGDIGPAFRGPPGIQAIIRGNRIYDSRTDTWMAGGG